jgi:intron-binding protein aquarius
MKLSPMYSNEENTLLRDQHSLLCHYTFFSIDDQTGIQHSRTEAYEKHCATLGHLQRVAFKQFKDKLAVLALSNYGSIDKRDDLWSLLEPLTDAEIVQLATHLDLRTAYPESLKLPMDRKLVTEILLTTFERRKTFQDVARDIAIVPTEVSLYENTLLRTDSYDGTHPMALPKLNLQYLSVGDFLWRSLVLYRCESFHGIRKDIESALRRVRPETTNSGDVRFSGFSKMALPVSKPS